MTTPLYRQEALDDLRSSGFGTPIRLPRAQRIASILAVLAVVGLIVWISAGSYTRRTSVQGILEPEAGLVQIRSARPAKVSKLHVSVGEHVKAGSKLFTLATEQETEEYGDGFTARLDQLSNDRIRLEADISTAKQSFSDKKKDLARELLTARSKSARLENRHTLQTKKAAIKQGIVERLTPLLRKGYISSLQYQEAEMEFLQARSDLESILSERDEAKQTEVNLSSHMKRITDDLAETSSLIEGKLSSVQQSVLQTNADRSLLITAPLDGQVTNVFVSEGSGTSPSEVMATLVPNESTLIARLIIDSGAIGFVKIGTPLALRYRSFPYEKFGTHRAKVVRIPGSAIPTEQSLGTPSATPRGLVYRVDVQIPSQSIYVYGKEERLKAGMEVTADLMLDRRTLVEWMFEPLIGMNKRMDRQETDK